MANSLIDQLMFHSLRAGMTKLCLPISKSNARIHNMSHVSYHEKPSDPFNPEHLYGNLIHAEHLSPFLAEVLVVDARKCVPDEFLHLVRIEKHPDGGYQWRIGPLVASVGDDGKVLWSYPD